MAAAKPYLTSNDLIKTVQRKISMPLSQQTFGATDVLAFINDEMFSSQVPSVLSFHEEYFVFVEAVPILPNQTRYPIPDRAIGMKLRDVKWQDTNGNLFDMIRINPEDKSFYQRNIGTSETVSKYYIEGNDLVLLPSLTITNSLSIYLYYFLRPNQLVPNERAAIITNFANTITTLNANIVVDDTITIAGTDFTAVASAPTGNDFLIGANDIETATNLTAAINSSGLTATASNGTPSTSSVTLLFNNIADSQSVETSNAAGFVIPANIQMIKFDQVPSGYQDPITFQNDSLFVNGSQIDFLQTKPGHRTYAIDVTIPNNGISGTTVSFNISDVPTNMILGDYMCLANECIIPQIPPDLHNSLAQRAASMILAAMGDQQGLQVSQSKVKEMEKNQIGLLDSRVEGSALKVAPKHSLLRYQTQSGRRRRF